MLNRLFKIPSLVVPFDFVRENCDSAALIYISVLRIEHQPRSTESEQHTYVANPRKHTDVANPRKHTYVANPRKHTDVPNPRKHTEAATSRKHTEDTSA
jgi:hypothetical protein